MFKIFTLFGAANGCNASFFGLEPWWKYLPGSDFDSSHPCRLMHFQLLNGSSSEVPLVLLAVVDDLLRVAGLVALAFVFYGAFKYIGSQGSPDGTAQAQSTIINALIGLAIASIAILLVNFLGSKLGA